MTRIVDHSVWLTIKSKFLRFSSAEVGLCFFAQVPLYGQSKLTLADVDQCLLSNPINWIKKSKDVWLAFTWLLIHESIDLFAQDSSGICLLNSWMMMPYHGILWNSIITQPFSSRHRKCYNFPITFNTSIHFHYYIN